MDTAKIIRETTSTHVDNETGEITRQSHTNVLQLPKEPPYVKLYLEDVAVLNNLPKGASSLMHELLRQMNYEGMINLNSTVKKTIAKRLETTIQVIDNQMSKMVKNQVFFREGRGVIRPNPYIFGKGDWKDIYKQRNAWITVNYDKDGNRYFTSSFGEEEKN